MEIRSNNKCVKMRLPNGHVVDVLSAVLDDINVWVQDQPDKPESGGYIIGYQHQGTGNISLEAVSPPCPMDIRTRVRFDLRDLEHQKYLEKARYRKSYYMGVWHTHPQSVPIPSDLDWRDWNETMKLDQTGCGYVFFVIAGIKEWRLWVGDYMTGEIKEVYECPKEPSGLYIREVKEIGEKNN